MLALDIPSDVALRLKLWITLGLALVWAVGLAICVDTKVRTMCRH